MTHPRLRDSRFHKEFFTDEFMDMVLKQLALRERYGIAGPAPLVITYNEEEYIKQTYDAPQIER